MSMETAFLDPELARHLSFAPSLTWNADNLPAIRRMLDAPSEPAEEHRGAVEQLVHEATRPDGSILRLLVFVPRDRARIRAGLLHIHGGGYVAGSPEMRIAQNVELAAASGCVICSVDYRLAPEVSFPGPLDDCETAFAWLHAHASKWGIAASRLGVKGESAGGGLATALMLRAIRTGTPRAAFLHLTAPMLDDRTCLAAAQDRPLWNGEANRFGWTSYLGAAPGDGAIPPEAAPARAGSVAGLPPTFLSVGALDLFRQENLAFAGRLAQAAVPLELHVYPGACHGFEATPAAISRAARANSVAGLDRLIAAA